MQVFVFPAEQGQVQAIASERHLSMSDVCRSLILEGLARLEAVKTAVREFEA